MNHRTISPFAWAQADQDVILVRYLIEPKNPDGLGDVVDDLVEEFKGSAWTDLPRELLAEVEKVEASVAEVNINEFSNFATLTLAYPACHFDFSLGGFGQLLALIAGDNISSKNIASLRITDIFFPPEILKTFPGPSQGVAGIRARYGIPQAPLLQVILKPRLGLGPEGYADLAGRLALAGAEAVREDQMMISTRYCPFEARIKAVAARLKDAEQALGRPVIYYPNLSLSPARIPWAVDFLRSQGLGALTVNAVHQGIGLVEQLRHLAPDFILQAHRSGYVLLSNNRNYSVSYAVLAQLYHLAGADEIHIGSLFGRFDVKKQETLRSLEVISHPSGGQKPAFPIVSGNVFPGLMEANINELGLDVILMAGSAVIGHPSGLEAGVRSFKEMGEVLMGGQKPETYITNRRASTELLKALNLWPYKRDGINIDKEIQERVKEALTGQDTSDPDFLARAVLQLEDYRQRFQDEEIGLLAEPLKKSGRSSAGFIGQLAEKYVRKICLDMGMPYKQLFDALQELEAAQVLTPEVLDALHRIRMAYNQAKHKDVYIFLRDVEPLFEGLIVFFRFMEALSSGQEYNSLIESKDTL